MRYADLLQGAGFALTVGWLVVAVAVCLRLGVRSGGPPGAARRSLAPSAPAGPLLWGTGAAAGLFAVQAAVVDSVEDPGRLAAADRPVLDWMVAHRTPAWTVVMEAASRYGGTLGTLALAAAGTAVLLCLRRWWEAATVAIATLGVPVLVPLFKELYGRQRPPAVAQVLPETDPSLPSGHALGSIVIVGVLAVVAVRLLRPGVLRALVPSVAVVVVVLIGASRLYLGAHWMTDVLTSWFLGGSWLAVCLTALHLAARRWGGVRGDRVSWSSPAGTQVGPARP